MIRAVAFVPAGELSDVFVSNCLEHCVRRGYEVAGLVRGDWATAFKMIAQGMASVVVIARREHLDPDREPRVEFVGEDTQDLTRLAGRLDGGRRRRPRITS